MKEAFLALVRLGIGKDATIQLPSPIKWDEVEALAERHGLLGVIVNGVQKLPDNQRPPQLIWLRWVGKVMQNESQYGAQQEAAIELAQLFHNNGIRTYVLKGVIVAECYPKPSCRLSADFDCFLVNDGSTGSPQENDNENNVWERGNQVIENVGFEVKRNFYKNSTIYLPDLTVENHRYMVPFRGNKRLKSLERLLQQLINENHNDNENRFDRTWLYRPPVMVSALFLIEHSYSHFLHEGLNWRYVLDWVMFSRKHKDEIDWYVLDALIDEFGFRKFYNVFNEIGKEAFGNTYNSTLSTDSKLSTLNTQLKAKMLADIWAEKKKHKSDSGLKGKMGLAANTWKARWKYRYFSPISMPHALWIQVKGFIFTKVPQLN